MAASSYSIVCLGMKLLLLLPALLFAAAASAQTDYTTPARHRAENRRALRDAARYPAKYKDSHLAVSQKSLKRGQAGTPSSRDGRRHYRFDRTGTARVSEPTTPALRLIRKK